jgi:hypothetical protein
MSTDFPIVTDARTESDGVIHVPSRCPWMRTSLELTMGSWYRISATATEDYADDRIPCSPNGPIGAKGAVFDRKLRSPGPFNPFRYFFSPGVVKRLRVLRDGTPEHRRASFLTLIACIDMDDSESNCITIGAEREFQAAKSGKLYLFANDWPGGVGTEGEERFRDPRIEKMPRKDARHQNSGGVGTEGEERFRDPRIEKMPRKDARHQNSPFYTSPFIIN